MMLKSVLISLTMTMILFAEPAADETPAEAEEDDFDIDDELFGSDDDEADEVPAARRRCRRRRESVNDLFR